MGTTKKFTSLSYSAHQNNDLLQYWRVVRIWAQYKYSLSLPELEALLFLYSHGVFTTKDYNDFASTMNVFLRKSMLSLKEKGWIIVWKDNKVSYKIKYEVSYKAKKLVLSIYNKLRGEELISETPECNPAFKKSAPWLKRRSQRAIKRMNADIKKKRER